MRLMYAKVGWRHLSVPVNPLLLERRKQSYCGHQFRREPEGRLSDDGLPKEVERTVRHRSRRSG